MPVTGAAKPAPATGGKAAAKPATATASKAAAKPAGNKQSAAAVQTSRQAAGAAAAVAAAAATSLGRPQIAADEPLFMLFREDFHARQIFEYLRVQTVRELERHQAREIVKQLTRPVVESVERIRLKLAEKNRCLSGDEEYLREYRTLSGKK
jgi:hypothetical protein